eukprot:jgi/Picsp_1/4279/NSC_01788-R1_expressed protein [Chlorella variabilis]
MGRETSKALKWSLRTMAGISGALGVGFIIWAVIVQNPPVNALPIGLVVLGSLALAVCLLGFLSSFLGRWCLSVLLLVALLVNLGELAIVISLLADLDRSVNALVDNALDSEDNKKTEEQLDEEFRNDLDVARYIFLVIAILEFIAIIVAIVIRIRYPYKNGLRDGDEEDQLAAKSAMAQIQMEGLKHSVKNSENAGASDGNFYTSSKKMYKSVTRKMTKKYGEFTTDPAFQKKWWQNIPGFG